MDLARIVCSLIGLAIGVALALVAVRALSNGSVKPFRMGRWSEPDEVYRDNSPGEFWQWVVAYIAFSVGIFVLSILAALGKVKLR